jgi:hypothetical protein
MDEQRKELLHFIQRAQGFDLAAKLRLILCVLGEKPATFAALKINPKNLDEKAHFEKHLRACKIPFSAGRAKGYEEITRITGNTITWNIAGTWYGYDVFADKKQQRLFVKYVALVKRQQHEAADKLSGRLYNYPPCCVAHYIQEHDLKHLRRNYSHYSYYKHLHDVERAFPLVMHTACSTRCAATKRMNARYAAALKKHAPQFWKMISSAKKYSCDVIVDTESELSPNIIYGSRSRGPVFPKRDGHEYSLVTTKPLDKHYYLLNHLTKQRLPRGTVVPAKVTRRFTYADVALGKPKRTIKNLHHQRHFVLP